MSYENLIFDVEADIATITLNRPDALNALSRSLKEEMKTALAEAGDSDAVRVVVIRGAGRAFSAGYDVKGNDYPPERTVPNYAPVLRRDLEFTLAAFECPKPVIAQIHGYCMGGALEFALMCDLRFVSEETTLAVVETRFADGVATMIFPWIIGPARAKDIIFSGRRIAAEEALSLGLVNRVVAPDDLDEETRRYARMLTKMAPEALYWNKRAINGAMEAMGLRSALELGLEACIALDSTETEVGKQFYDIARREGVKAASRWRDSQFEDMR